MDLVSAVGLVQSSIGLALQFGKVAKTLNDVANKYKNAKLAIKSLAQNLDILELAWTQIGEWFQGQSEDGLYDDSLTKRVVGFLETGVLVIEALQYDLQAYNMDDIGFSQRTKFLWNEISLEAHRSRIRDQALSMSLFLQVVQLYATIPWQCAHLCIDAGTSDYNKLTLYSPTPQARAKLLHKSESLFQKSDESAYSTDSIVPSRMSASTGPRDSYVSDQNDDTVQSRRMSFEKGLFMSRVYLRNYKNVMAKEISKARRGSKLKVGITTADQTAKNWEAIRDQIEADSLLARSREGSICDNDTVRSSINSESRHRFSEEVSGDQIEEDDNLLATVYEEPNDDNDPFNNIKSESRHRFSEEVIRDRNEGNGLIAKFEGPINDNNIIRSHTSSESRHGFSEEVIAIGVSGALFDSELIRTCEQGDSLQAKWLAVRGVDLHAHFKQGSYSGLTAIHVAVIHGHIDVVKALLSCGASIEEETASECRRPLHLAALTGQVSMTKYLIREGAQLDAKSQHGMQPIHDASWSGSVEILDALTAAGARVDCLDSFGRQPLHWAAMTPNQSDFIQCLVRKGADIEAKAFDGSRPLRLACTSDPTKLRTLVDLGAMTDYDDGSESVLETAIEHDSKWALKILLSNGADPNCQNHRGKTVLFTLARSVCNSLGQSSDDLNMCRLLLDHGVDVHLKDKEGNQVLHCLASHSSGNFATTQELAKLLLDRGAALNDTNDQGCSPLYIAIYYGNRQLSRLLLESGSRILINLAGFDMSVQARWLIASPMPFYTLRIRHSDSAFQPQGEISAHGFELSLDGDGYFTESAVNIVCSELWYKLYQRGHAFSPPSATLTSS